MYECQSLNGIHRPIKQKLLPKLGNVYGDSTVDAYWNPFTDIEAKARIKKYTCSYTPLGLFKLFLFG